MNQLIQELIFPFLTEDKIQKGTALIPGKYKPPHKGHLEVAKKLSEDFRIKNIVILISPKTVEGITPELSKEIWEKYLQKYGIKAKILLSNEPSPVKAAVNIIKNNPDNFYYVVTGYRTEEDLKDLARGNFTAKYGNADAIVVEGEDIRATRIRQYLADRDYPAFSLNLPDRLTNAEKQQIYNKLIEVVPTTEKEVKENKVILSNFEGDLKPNDMIKAPKGAKLYNKQSGKPIILNQSKIFKVINYTQIKPNIYKLNLETKGDLYWVLNYEIGEGWVLSDEPITENKILEENKLKDSVKKLKDNWVDFTKAIKQESKETQEAFVLLNQAAQGKITLTSEQKKQIGDQMKNVLKTLGYLTILALPGGSIVAILLKVLRLNKYVLPTSFLKEETKNFDKLEYYKEYYKNISPSNFNVEINEDKIEIFGIQDKISLKESSTLAWNPKESLVTLSKYLMNELGITEAPNIELKEDEENAKDILGKTAYYNPSTHTITLYITDRHPKDILRSFSHEMIHHKQNLEGRLENVTTTNTNEDDELTELEREAYELGNILFRNWEDKIKND
jgi:hypothetical protein